MRTDKGGKRYAGNLSCRLAGGVCRSSICPCGLATCICRSSICPYGLARGVCRSSICPCDLARGVCRSSICPCDLARGICRSSICPCDLAKGVFVDLQSAHATLQRVIWCIKCAPTIFFALFGRCFSVGLSTVARQTNPNRSCRRAGVAF